MVYKDSLDKYIIKLPQTHKDTIKVGGKTLYLDASWNPIKNRIPFAEVVSIPSKIETPVKVGDVVYFHHNIVQNKMFKIDDEHYYIPAKISPPMVYAIKRDNTITPINGYMFIEPIEVEEIEKGGIYVVLNNEWPSKGYIRYAAKESLDALGCSIGDKINFRKFRNYIIEINNEGLIRLRDKDVNFIYNG